MRHVTIDIPAPYFAPVRNRKSGKLKPVGPWLNSNDRLHRMQEAKITKAWRATAAEYAKYIPPFTSQVHILAHIFKPRDTHKFDPNNLHPTTKAIVDGLVDAGLFVDDSRQYVIGPDHRWGGKGLAEVVLEITELPAREQP
jgi:crossover junction endodeoxyribonuclease RusA